MLTFRQTGLEADFTLVRSSIISGLCSMVPIPFLDDFLLNKCRKILALRLVGERGAEIDATSLRIYYAGERKGCLATAIGLVFSIIRKVLKKLLRTFFFFLAVRKATMEMVETFLLGHSLERYLTRGHLDVDCDEEAEYRLTAMRKAFEASLRGTDRQIMACMMRRAWTMVSGNRGVLRKLVRRARNDASSTGFDDLKNGELSQAERDALQDSTESLKEEIRRREVQEFLRHYDAKFDDAFHRATQPPELSFPR